MPNPTTSDYTASVRHVQCILIVHYWVFVPAPGVPGGLTLAERSSIVGGGSFYEVYRMIPFVQPETHWAHFWFRIGYLDM